MSSEELNKEQERSKAEEARVSAEKDRKDKFDEEFNKLVSDPKHYVTPGAKKYFRRVTYGYLILAIAATIGIYAVSNRNDTNLRRDINALAARNCIAGIPTLNKYNDLVNDQIQANIKSRALNIKHGRDQAAKINDDNIARLSQDLLTVPTKEQCQKPILRP